MLDAALAERVLSPADVVGTITPDVMASHLPPDLLGRLLSDGLAQGAMTPERLIASVSTRAIAEHVPGDLVWATIGQGLDRAVTARLTELRRTLDASLAAGLELAQITPDDILARVPADTLATHLPRPLWARLLTASLGAAKLDSEIIVNTLGVTNLAEHMPPDLLISCIRIAAEAGSGGPRKSAPSGFVTPASKPAPPIAPPLDDEPVFHMAASPSAPSIARPLGPSARRMPGRRQESHHQDPDADPSDES